MPAKKKPALLEGLQTWHIAIFVLMVLILGWKLLGYMGEQRRLSDVKYEKGTPTVKGAPGSTRAMQEEEK